MVKRGDTHDKSGNTSVISNKAHNATSDRKIANLDEDHAELITCVPNEASGTDEEIACLSPVDLRIS